MKNMYVYIITNRYKGTLYIGVTNNLFRRIYEHKNKIIEGFSSKYNLNKLVYYECFDSEEFAILREKQLKGWTRKRKIELIESKNLYWNDLYDDLASS